jgi:hypothetical protein
LAVGSWQLAVGSWQLAENFKKAAAFFMHFFHSFALFSLITANCQLITFFSDACQLILCQ